MALISAAVAFADTFVRCRLVPLICADSGRRDSWPRFPVVTRSLLAEAGRLRFRLAVLAGIGGCVLMYKTLKCVSPRRTHRTGDTHPPCRWPACSASVVQCSAAHERTSPVSTVNRVEVLKSTNAKWQSVFVQMDLCQCVYYY